MEENLYCVSCETWRRKAQTHKQSHFLNREEVKNYGIEGSERAWRFSSADISWLVY
jgi:hypothetical protein